MPRIGRKDYKPIQLLATPEILDWWKRHAKDSARQEKLRQAVLIGLDVMEGRIGTITAEQKVIYEAMETLFKSGYVVNQVVDPKIEPKKEKKKPKIGKLRDQYSEARK